MENKIFFTSSVVDRIREKMIQDVDRRSDNTTHTPEYTISQKSTEEIRRAFIYASESLSVCGCR